MSPDKPTGPSSHFPVVRHFIACERIQRSPDGRQYSLLNLVHVIRPSEGAEYPYRRDELCFFVQMTDGRGTNSFQLQLVILEDEETTNRTTPGIARDLGPNPIAVHGWSLTLRNILFPRAGLYEFRLLCNGHEIAREPILLSRISQ